MLKSSEEVGGMCGQYEEFVLGHTLCINLNSKVNFWFAIKLSITGTLTNMLKKNFTEFNTKAARFPLAIHDFNVLRVYQFSLKIKFSENK